MQNQKKFLELLVHKYLRFYFYDIVLLDFSLNCRQIMSFWWTFYFPHRFAPRSQCTAGRNATIAYSSKLKKWINQKPHQWFSSLHQSFRDFNLFFFSVFFETKKNRFNHQKPSKRLVQRTFVLFAWQRICLIYVHFTRNLC